MNGVNTADNGVPTKQTSTEHGVTFYWLKSIVLDPRSLASKLLSTHGATRRAPCPKLLCQLPAIQTQKIPPSHLSSLKPGTSHQLAPRHLCAITSSNFEAFSVLFVCSTRPEVIPDSPRPKIAYLPVVGISSHPPLLSLLAIHLASSSHSVSLLCCTTEHNASSPFRFSTFARTD